MRAKSSHFGRETRRQFIKKTGMAAATVAGAGVLQFSVYGAEGSPAASIVLDPGDVLVKQPPVQWAVGELRAALEARGVASATYDSIGQVPASPACVVVGRELLKPTNPAALATPESFVLELKNLEKRRALSVCGSDERGLVYALLELADRVKFAANPLAALNIEKPISEQPANAIRSMSRAFVSDVEDQAWFPDRDFWPSYLTMLAANRFNRFSLTLGLGYDAPMGLRDTYFYFAYPFLLPVPGYRVRAVPLADTERDRNLAMLRFISDETVRRGLRFQLGIWTHAYQWTDSPDVNYTIEGLTPETQGPYCRDALRALLEACPSIGGMTFRIHGESGVAEGSYDFWKTVFDGVVQCGRRVEIDMHAKGMDQPMIDVALGTGMPIVISPKFWAEHMGLPYMQGSIRQLEMPANSHGTGFFSRSSGSRSFLRYGYGDLLAEDRRYQVLHRIWPGTQRLLLWGDPEMAAAYGRVANFCGSNGVEIFEPLFFKGRKGSGLPGGRDAYAEPALKPALDFEKYDYTYRVWGRNLYHPGGDADGWQRSLRSQVGAGAESAGAALASASRILPLVTTAHCPSAANNNYWPEMYYDMSLMNLSRRHPYGDTRSPKLFGNVSPLDPEFFLGIDEYAEELLGNEISGKYSPVWVATRLEEEADKAMAELRKVTPAGQAASAEFQRLAADVAIQAGLGRFFAAKFRAGVFFALYQRSNFRPALEEAVRRYHAARDAWAALSEPPRHVYLPDITFGPDYFQRSQWVDRLPVIDDNIADLEALLTQSSAGGGVALKVDSKIILQAMHKVFAKPPPESNPPLPGLHEPAASFRRGQSLTVSAHAPDVDGVCLRYRRVNQAETWQAVEMEHSGSDYRAVISASYTDTPFPLQYYFQLRDRSGTARLAPGWEHPWHGQPYYFVRQAR